MKKNIPLRDFGIIAILVLVMGVFSLGSENFLTFSNMRTILLQVSSVAVCSLGMMFVLLTGGIDLSVGYMATSVGMLSAYCMAVLNMNGAAAFAIALIFALVIGAIQGVMVARILVPPFIVTMAFMNMLKGFSYLITSGKAIYDLPEFVRNIGQGSIIGIPTPVFIMIVCLLVANIFTREIYFGRYFYAVGSNEEAAKLSGINTRMVKIITYVISAFFAYLAGIIILGRLGTASPGTGAGFEFDVITACVLGGISMTGGKGQVFQAAVGAMIIAVLNNGMIQLHIDTYVQLVIKGLILLLAVAFDSIQQNSKKKVHLVNAKA